MAVGDALQMETPAQKEAKTRDERHQQAELTTHTIVERPPNDNKDLKARNEQGNQEEKLAANSDCSTSAEARDLEHEDRSEVKTLHSTLKHTSSPFFTSIASLDADHRDDPDQELSPTPLTKSSSSSDASYDLWGSWSVRSFGNKSDGRSSNASPPPLSGSDKWRSFRSLSIDDTPASPPALALDVDTELGPISSINRSLRSLSFASHADDLEPTAQTDKRSQRPRSFSDYTSLGAVKLNDIWNERVPQLEPFAPSESLAGMFDSAGVEMYRAMKATVASRHVIIKSAGLGGFDTIGVRRILDALNGFGAVASIREEFTSDGVLFCTFYELKAAIGAVKMWFTNQSTRASVGETVAHFSLPYEPSNEINCATVLVQIHGPPFNGTSNDMRQLCSRYGQVASVLERDASDGSANQFIVEFNDVRDIATAMIRLTGSPLAMGHMISVARSHPPTLDHAKIQAFQESVENQKQQSKQFLTAPRLGNRPKSYSESTTLIASPSSTSSSSPLTPSFLEVSSSSFAHRKDVDANIAISAPGSRSSSPLVSPGVATTTNDAWRSHPPARPRASSAYASLSTGMASALLADNYTPSPAQQTSGFSHQYGGTHHQYRPPVSQSSPLHHQSLQHPHYFAMNGRGGVARTGNDFHLGGHSYAGSSHGSNSSTTGSVGRNDQGTGEYSLSIVKVASGEETRTTLMVRNIPNKYTQQMLLSEINAHHHGKYDFFYLPIDFKNKCNMGYAFINFIDADTIVPFYQEFHAQKWTNFNSEKVCAISYARLQGKQAMITRFQNSSLLDKHESYRPLVFHSTGPNRGKLETFPAPKLPIHATYQQQQFLHKTTKFHPHHHHHQQQHQPHHHQLMMNDDYLLAAAHTGRLYAQQQHHALLANAHAAAAAMLHNMPALGMSTNTAMAAASYAPPCNAFQYGGQSYGQQGGIDRRTTHTGHTYPAAANGLSGAVGSATSFGGSAFSSTSA